MLWVELRCPGREGETNGCPEGFGERGLGRGARHSHDAVKDTYAALLREADAKNWVRSTRDLQYRCPACAVGHDHPAEIAGIPWAKWEEALQLYEAGQMPASWGGKNGLPTARQFHNSIRRYPKMLERVKAAPAYTPKPMESRAAPLGEEMWERVAARFEAGEQKLDICTAEDGWPTAFQWNKRMAIYPEFARRINAVHEARMRLREERVDWDSALSRFLAGEHLSNLLGQSGMPTRNQWHRRLRDDEAFRQTIFEQYFWRGEALPVEARGEAEFERALQLIREGMWLREACLQPGAVPLQAFSRRVARDAQFARQYTDALIVSGREQLTVERDRDGRLFKNHQHRDWIGAVEALREGKHLTEVIARIPIGDYPSEPQWYRRIKSDRAFAAIVKRAYSDGAAQRQISLVAATRDTIDKAISLIRSGKTPKEAAVSCGIHVSLLRKRCEDDPVLGRRYRDAIAEARLVRSVHVIGSALQRRLLQNEIVAAVSAAIPRRLPPDMRDEIMSNMVLAVLEGQIAIEDIPANVKKFTSAYNRENSYFKTRSLDEVIPGTDGLTLGDRLTTEHERF